VPNINTISQTLVFIAFSLPQDGWQRLVPVAVRRMHQAHGEFAKCVILPSFASDGKAKRPAQHLFDGRFCCFGPKIRNPGFPG
jgi:hypothetical protein